MPGSVVRPEDAHRALDERRMEELERALAALVEAWDVPDLNWWRWRDDYDARIAAARALLAGTGEA
jgi:hypothetical protein